MTEPVSTLLMRRRSVQAGVAMAALAVTLTACGGGADDADTGAPVSTQSASAEVSPEPDGSEGAASSAGASGSSTASPEASEGEFVPASSEGPAQNVPVPEMPAAAREQTQEGLEAALEYWWDAAYYIKTTGGSDHLDRISADNCGICNRLLETWPDIYDAQGWAAIEPTKLAIEYSTIDTENNTGSILFLVTEKPGQVFRPDGSLVEEASGDGNKDTPWTAAAVFEDGKWAFQDLRAQ